MPATEFKIESTSDNGRVAVLESRDDDDGTLVMRVGSEAHRGWVHLTRSEALALAGALRAMAFTLDS